jgi:ubiquinone biosynthesis O-methyltransferase
VSTLNRTLKSWGLAIVAAEWILRLLDRGTHDWNKFITPEELTTLLARSGLTVEEIKGLFYNPLTSSCTISSDTSVNYILCARSTVDQN